MDNLNPEVAYKAMILFLEKYFAQTNSDDVGALLGSMRLLDDSRPADAAMWSEWQQAICDATAENNLGQR